METQDDVAGFRVELGRRIAIVVATFPTKSAASNAAGVTPEQLNRWIAGEVKVPVDALWRLSRTSGVDFSWLCAGTPEGRAEPPQPVATILPGGRVLQESALRDVLAALAEVTATDGIHFAPDRFADLAFALHDYLVERRRQDGAQADLAGMSNIIRLAAQSRR